MGHFFNQPNIEAVLADLNNPNIRTVLPFPSTLPALVPERIPLEDFQFSFLGRVDKVNALFNRIVQLKRQESLVVKGNTGSGKSTILAVCVLRLMMQQFRVVYIPDCKLFSVGFDYNLLNAVEVAFPEKFNRAMFTNPVAEIRDYIRSILIAARDDPKPVIFILDGFNCYDQTTLNNMSSSVEAVRAQDQSWFLRDVAMGCNGVVIKVMTAENTSFRRSTGSIPFPGHHLINGGLSMDEWNGWKTFAPFHLLANPLTHDQDQLAHVTGLLPIILHKLTCFGNELNLDDRLNRYYRDDDAVNFGGLWSEIELRHFTEAIIQGDSQCDIAMHIDMMMHAINQSTCNKVHAAFMDQRFFFHDTTREVIVPVCGHVTQVMARILSTNQTTMHAFSQNHRVIELPTTA